MVDENLKKIEKRLDALEQKVARLEIDKIQTNYAKIEVDSSRASSGRKRVSVKGIIFVLLGGYFLLSSLPSLFYAGSYSYGFSYFQFFPAIMGVFLLVLGLRFFKTSRKDYANLQSKSSEIASLKKNQPLVEKHSEQSFEFQLASHWFAVVGIIAIVFAVVFFLKFAFDNGLIGPVGQVIIGLTFGILLIFAGEFLREKVARYSQIISAGGIVILYLSIWAAYSLFHLISPIIILTSMSVITVLSSLLAIRYSAVYIGVLGVIGGFATPILLGKGFDNQLVLLSYVVVLNIGVLAVSFFKNWRELSVATFTGTYIVVLAWLGNYWKIENFVITFSFITLIFLLFAVSLFIYNFIYKKEAQESDIILMLLNALVYFGLGYYLMTDAQYKEFIGFFAFALSAFYFILGSLSYHKFKESSYLTLGFLGISIFFLTIAVPLQIKKNLITIVWSLEGVSLLLLGFLINSQKLRLVSLAIYVLVVIRLFGFDTQINSSEFNLILNSRFLTFVISAISMSFASYLYIKYKQNLDEDEKMVLPTILIALNVLLIWSFSWESISYYGKKIDEFKKAQLQTSRQDVKISGYKIVQALETQKITQATGSAKPNVVASPNPYVPNYNYPNNNSPGRNQLPRYYSPPASKPLKQLNTQAQDKIKGFESARDISLSVIWLLYSIILLTIGVVAKYKPVRLFALGFLMVTIIKVFVYDSRNLQQGYRIVAFMILGVILLAISLIYQKYRARISAFLLNDK